MRQKKASPDPRKENRFSWRRGYGFAVTGMEWRVKLRCKICRTSLRSCWAGAAKGREKDFGNAKSERGFSTCTAFQRCICLCRARRLRRAAYVGMGADLPHVALLVLRSYAALASVGDGVLDVPLARRARNKSCTHVSTTHPPRKGRRPRRPAVQVRTHPTHRMTRPQRGASMPETQKVSTAFSRISRPKGAKQM